MKIEELNLSNYTLDILKNHTHSSYKLVEDLTAKTQGEFMRDIKKGNLKTLKEVSQELNKHGLKFKGKNTFNI